MLLGSATGSSTPPPCWLPEGSVVAAVLVGEKWPLEFFRVRYSGCIPVANMDTAEWARASSGLRAQRAASRSICIRLDRRPLTPADMNPQDLPHVQQASGASETITHP